MYGVAADILSWLMAHLKNRRVGRRQWILLARAIGPEGFQERSFTRTV